MGNYTNGSFPGGRSGATSWTTNSSFWLFGGLGYDNGDEGLNCFQY